MEFYGLRQFSFVPANAAGIALYEKFRFEIEGIQRRFASRGGEYVDAYPMVRVGEWDSPGLSLIQAGGHPDLNVPS